MAFGVFGIVFAVIFIAAVSIIATTAVKGIRTWDKNNSSPRITVPAVLVSKRTNVSHRTQANAGDVSGTHGFHRTYTSVYYVTFQFASGDRQEFCVDGSEYGMLAEGDEGNLSFQGTRYQAFERKI